MDSTVLLQLVSPTSSSYLALLGTGSSIDLFDPSLSYVRLPLLFLPILYAERHLSHFLWKGLVAHSSARHCSPPVWSLGQPSSILLLGNISLGSLETSQSRDQHVG